MTKMSENSLSNGNGLSRDLWNSLPPEWRIGKIGDLFDIRQGKALSQKFRKGKNPKPFLRTANVYWGKVDLTTLDQMDFTEDEQKQYTLLYAIPSPISLKKQTL